MKKDLGIDRLPRHMECFDNSNIQGTNPVAACVVFKNGKPAKSEYRKFHVKTVVGADDYRTMREIIYRRYRRMLDEGQSLPDLIIIDGGKGQLHAACDTLKELGIYDKVCVFGLAERFEELYRPGESEPLVLDRRSETLKVVCHIRDEAHRFAITGMRAKRAKSRQTSRLENLEGVGPKRRAKLLTHFGGMKQLKNASVEQIARVDGISEALATKIYAQLHQSTEISSAG